MIQAHCFDGMICIPNCDKIVPGMLMGAVRCNIPTIFVSGGPMEAGKTPDGKTVDLIDVFIGAAAKQDGKLSAERTARRWSRPAAPPAARAPACSRPTA